MTLVRTRSRGFTLIEVLVVVAIIALLAGMLFVALRFTTSKAKRDTTRVMLQTLRGMQTEREIAEGPTLYKSNVNAAFATASTNASDSSVIKIVLPEFTTQRYPSPVLSVSAPTSLTPTNGMNATSMTQYVMYQLLAMPANKTVFGNIASKQYLEKQDATAGAFNPPLLMDGYGNPVIAVPSTGLTNVKLNWSGISGDPIGTTKTITAPDGKPFFASAGPDGNFETGDDNVYSFSN